MIVKCVCERTPDTNLATFGWYSAQATGTAPVIQNNLEFSGRIALFGANHPLNQWQSNDVNMPLWRFAVTSMNYTCAVELCEFIIDTSISIIKCVPFTKSIHNEGLYSLNIQYEFFVLSNPCLSIINISPTQFTFFEIGKY